MHHDGEIVERLPLPEVKELEGILTLRAGIAREVLASALLPEAAAVLPSAASAIVAAFLASGHPSVSGVMERRADGGLRIRLRGLGRTEGASPPQVSLPPLLPGGVRVGPEDGGAAWCIEALGGAGPGESSSPATLYETEAAWLRMASGSGRMNVVAVRPLLEELQAAFSGRARTTGVSLRVALPEEDLRMRTDRDRLFGLLSELAGNAFRFSSTGNEIVVSAGKAGGLAYITVKDTGPGMSPEILETLFRWDWEPGRTPPEESRGPGFALSRRTAEGMGGSLDAESEVGVGTTVRVGLPLA